MFMRSRLDGAEPPVASGAWTRFVIGVAAGLIIVFGLFPDSILRLTRASATSSVPPPSVPATAQFAPTPAGVR